MEFYDNLQTVMKHFSESGAFLTVKSGGTVNTMTIRWGFIGYMWNKPYFITVVRPQRYTKELIDTASDFTISVPINVMAEELQICGKNSGRDIDKNTVVHFTDSKTVSSPIVGGCGAYYECRINYRDKLREELLPDSIIKNFYKDDFHEIFMGEIVECYC